MSDKHRPLNKPVTDTEWTMDTNLNVVETTAAEGFFDTYRWAKIGAIVAGAAALAYGGKRVRDHYVAKAKAVDGAATEKATA